jgi:hypothetical protein
MTEPLQVEYSVPFGAAAKQGRRTKRTTNAPTSGRIPRVAKQMALAIHMEGLLRDGTVRSYADLGRLGHVTRAYMTRIMNLLLLAPDLQEALLFLEPIEAGRTPFGIGQLQPLAREPDWTIQRLRWAELMQAIAERRQSHVS